MVIKGLRRAGLKIFSLLPSFLLAEPFEVFLVVLGLLDAVALIINRVLNTDRPILDYYHGPVGLVAFAAVVGIASVAIIASLLTMESKNLMGIRKLEITGLWMYAAAFGYYGYANLAIGLRLHLQPVILTLLSEVILGTLTLCCAVRAISLGSPITALSVARVHRVKQIKAEVRRLLDEG